MATFDATMGMWKAKNGRYYTSQAEAQNADANTLDDADFMGTSGIDRTAPEAPAYSNPRDQPNPNNPGGISDNELLRRQTKLSSGATQTANINQRQDRTSGTGAALGRTPFQQGGAYSGLSDASRAGYDYMHQLGSAAPVLSMRQAFNRFGEDAGVSHAGDVVRPGAVGVSLTPWQPVANQMARTIDPNSGMGTTLAGGNGSPVTRQAAQFSGGSGTTSQVDPYSTGYVKPPGSGDAGRAGIDQETADAKTNAENAIRENRDENQQLFADAFQRYDDLTGGDYALSDEARGYQREGLQQQRMLLQKMLSFDEDQAATRYADQTLARQIAAGRSAGGGAAGQQAGMFAAMEQAPSLYAQGRQQAANEQTTRLGQAEQAAAAFGNLGTMTRGQDEQRAQFEAELSKGIADSVANLTQGNVQMNDRDSQQMAEIWMDFAKLQSVYAGMSSEEQLAWWQNETARRGQDQNFKAITEQLKAQGKISPKDIIGGLFTLGGGVLSAGGSLGNAYMQGQTARDVARINAGGGSSGATLPAPTAPGYAPPTAYGSGSWLGTTPPNQVPLPPGDYDPNAYGSYA